MRVRLPLVMATPLLLWPLLLRDPQAAVRGRQSVNQDAYTHPQQMIEIAPSRRMNLYCTGHGSPTIVMDAGFGSFSAAWRYVQPDLSLSTRVCSYDRAGEGFSDPGPLPRTSRAIVDDLRALLAKAGIAPPIVLVGHSFGGLNAVLYANLHLQEVSGLVLVDPAVAGQDKAGAEVIPNLYALNAEGLQRAKMCEAAARNGTIKPGEPAFADCSLSEPDHGAGLRGAVETMAARVSTWRTLRSEAEQLLTVAPGALSRDMQDVAASRRSYGALPLIVLAATVAPGFLGPKEGLAWMAVRRKLLDGVAARSTRGVTRHVARAGHSIQIDRPDAVIRAILDVVAAVRATRAEPE